MSMSAKVSDQMPETAMTEVNTVNTERDEVVIMNGNGIEVGQDNQLDFSGLNHLEEEPSTAENRNGEVAIELQVLSSNGHVNSETSPAGEADGTTEAETLPPIIIHGNVMNASMTFALVFFNIIWTSGMSYYHFACGNYFVGTTTLIIILMSGFITSLCFLMLNPLSEIRGTLWRCSKLASFMSSIPCLAPPLLASLYFISSLSDKAIAFSRRYGYNALVNPSGTSEGQSRTELPSIAIPPSSEEWRVGSGFIFLFHGLSHCFPTCLLYLCFLMESTNQDPIHTFINVSTFIGLIPLSFSITFFRLQIDTHRRRSPFLNLRAFQKSLLLFYLWSADLIWILTFAIFIVTARLVFLEMEYEATFGAIGVLLAAYEIPLWIWIIFLLSRLHHPTTKASSLFFILSQIISLTCFVLWICTDLEIFQKYIPLIVFVCYFVSEGILICGWLMYGSASRHLDPLAIYPKILGDVFLSYGYPPAVSSSANP